MKKRTTELSDLMGAPKKKSIGSLLFFIFIFTILGLSSYVGWLKYDLLTKKQHLQATITKLEATEKKEIEKEGYSKSKALKEAQIIHKKAQDYRIKWSHIYKDVTALELDRVNFYHFSADKDQVFNINGITSNMDNISKLLNQLKNNPKFEKPFISQVSEVRKDNKKAFNFILSFNYKELNPL